ncbi:MAG: phenylalanine--tRNA ligase subunit beta [Acidimicrobiales bacterium]
MRTPLSWLQSLTPLPVAATDRGAVAELASELDSLGLVVERVEKVGEGLADVVLARVVEISAIAGADRIRKVVLDRGDPNPVEVVCGAWNFEVGDVVPLAPVGAVLPGGFRMERRKMRGVVSNGMICSARELGLGADHEGILVLSSARGRVPEPGITLAEHLGIAADVVFDLAIEPNRPDCLCMAGIARDLAARFKLPFHLPEPLITESDLLAASLASVAVEARELCYRLSGRVLTNVALVPSPMLVQRRLTMAGMRPINSVVDASNYVMLELGQPTHPYDLDRLAGRGLIARAARPGEAVVTLDGETRILGTRDARPGDDLAALDCVICDAEGAPIGIAGVMGGRSSEVEDATSSVLLETALFNPVAVLRSARLVGLRTEASIRFERGVDSEGVERAAARVCELIVDAARSAGTQLPSIARGLLDDQPVISAPVRIPLAPDRINALLGTTLGVEEMAGLLEPIGYRADIRPDSFDVLAPSFRPDVRREADVAEDIARCFGYSNVARTNRRSPYVGRLDEVQHLRRRIRRILSGLGAHEAWTSSITDPLDHARACWGGPLLRLRNPMVEEESALRPALLAGLLMAVRHNVGHRQAYVRLFEIGDVFRAPDVTGGLPVEQERIALVLAGETDDAVAAVQAWRAIEEALGLCEIEFRQQDEGTAVPPELAGLHPTRSCRLVLSSDGAVLGSLGEVDPDVISSFALPHPRIGWLELDMVRLLGAPRRSTQARPVSRYPSSDVDLAFVVEQSTPAAQVRDILQAAGTELCESVELFDVYRGPGLRAGERSLAFRMRFCAVDHTLTDAEVAELRRQSLEAVESALPARLRG